MESKTHTTKIVEPKFKNNNNWFNDNNVFSKFWDSKEHITSIDFSPNSDVSSYEANPTSLILKKATKSTFKKLRTLFKKKKDESIKPDLERMKKISNSFTPSLENSFSPLKSGKNILNKSNSFKDQKNDLQTLFNVSNSKEATPYSVSLENSKFLIHTLPKTSSLKSNQVNRFSNIMEQSTPLKNVDLKSLFDSKKKNVSQKEETKILTNPINYDLACKTNNIEKQKKTNKEFVNKKQNSKNLVTENKQYNTKFTSNDFTKRIQELKSQKLPKKDFTNISFGSISNHENSENSFLLKQ